MSSTSPFDKMYLKSSNNNNLVEIDEIPTDTDKFTMIKGDEFLISKINELYSDGDSKKTDNLEKLIEILSKVESIDKIDFDSSSFKIDDIVLNFQDMNFSKVVESISRRANGNDIIKYFLYKSLIDRFHFVINELIKDYKKEAKEGKPYNKKRVNELRVIYDTDCRKLISYKKKLLNKPLRSLIDECKLYDYYEDIIQPSVIVKSLIKKYMGQK